MVEGFRHGLTASEPVGEIRLRQVEELLDLRQLLVREGAEPGRDKAADQKVKLMRAAMGGSEQKAPAALIEVGCGISHG